MDTVMLSGKWEKYYYFHYANDQTEDNELVFKNCPVTKTQISLLKLQVRVEVESPLALQFITPFLKYFMI